MKKRNKTLLFLICLVCFLLATPITIFYSQGYRFDFEKRKVTKTGGLFLTAKPKKAKVYINGHFRKDTDFLFGSSLIENLLPGKYKITVSKEGFQKWEKELEIEEKKVTEAKKILLWPEILPFETLTSNIEKIYLSPDKNKAILMEIEEPKEILKKEVSNEESTEEKVSSNKSPQNISPPTKKQNLKLYDFGRKIKSHLISTDDFRENNTEILNILWAPDSQGILLETAAKEQVNPVRKGGALGPTALSEKESDLYSSPPQGAGLSNGVKYWLLEILPQPKLISLGFIPQDILRLEFHPQNPQKIFLQKLQQSSPKTGFSNFLFEADLKEKKVNPLPFLQDFITLSISEENLFWLTPDGFLYKSPLTGEKKEKINQAALDFQKGEVEYKIFVNKENNIFFQEGANIFWFNEESKAFEKVLEGVSNLELSPENNKVTITTNHEIWILFLKEETGPPQSERGKKLFLTRFAENIGKIFWLNSDYLLFNVGDKIKIIEIDERDRIQAWDLAESKGPDIFFNQNDKKLYIFSGGKLSSSIPLF